MKKTIALLLSACILLTCIGCKEKQESVPVVEETVEDTQSFPQDLAVSLGEAPKTMICADADATDASYLMHLFDSLYHYDAAGACINGIAQTESVDETGLVWTFTLREDAVWSDGQPVRAQDFVYAWQRAVKNSPYASLFLPIKNAASIIEGKMEATQLGVTAVSDTQLQVTFTQKMFRVSPLLVHHAFYPLREDLAASYDVTKSDFDATKLVTNGAYRITQYTEGGMMLVQSDSYYAKDTITQDSIQFLFMDDETQYTSFMQNNLYYADNITDDIRLASFGIDQSPITTADKHAVTAIVLHHDAAPLDDVNVRKALLLSVRQQDYADATFSSMQPAAGLIPSSFSTPDAAAHFRDGSMNLLVNDSDYAQNLVLAKNLLTEAGYEDVSSLNALEFIYNHDDPMQESLAQLLAQNWKQTLGFTPTLIPLSSEEMQSRLQGGEYAIALCQMESEIDEPVQILRQFITGVYQNHANYASLSFDTLMGQAVSAADVNERYSLYHQAEEVLLEEAAVIPLLFGTTQGLQKDELQNVITTGNGTLIFSYCNIVQEQAE